MTPKYSIRGSDIQQIQPDQEAVMDAYLVPGGRVSVGAGAGTGKTFTLNLTLAEQVLLLIQGKAPEFNPMKRILVVSFGKEASRQLKTKIKGILREHETIAGPLPESIWRFIESESNIQTIDSFLQSLLREIAVEAGVNPAFEVPNQLDQEQLVDNVLESILQAKVNMDAWQRLERAFPSMDFMDYPPESLRQMVWNTHQKMREFCMDAQAMKTMLLEKLEKVVHQGNIPPLSITSINALANVLSGGTFQVQAAPGSQQPLIRHAEEVYATSKQVAEDFGNLLVAFDKEYDGSSRRDGKLTYNDMAYLVWRYTYTSGDAKWTSSLSNRFDYILVDEFQDTNYVQYQMLLSLVRNTPAKNNVMFIGDVKQSIYKWRSAEPKIFIELMEKIRAHTSLGKLDGMVYLPLTSNFRSNESLITAYNGMFGELFQDLARGAVVDPILYENLTHKRDDIENKDRPKLHVLLNAGSNTDAWLGQEVPDVTSAIHGMLQSNSPITVYDSKKKENRPPMPGDIALLFRRTTNIPTYVNSLRRSGVSCALQTDVSLFSEPEVSLVIDFLNWLANPDSRESVTRILRSPIVSLSDKTLRYLSSKSFRLVSALKAWTSTLGLPPEDKERLQDLLDFKDDLRWDREGPKSALISKIIAHGRLDSVLLSSVEGVQAQANLWLLGEVVSTWEEEELLSYQDFVERLVELRERGRDGSEGDYPRAVLADESTTSSVKIMTVHASKGLEFPIVIIPETIVTTNEFMLKNERIARTRDGGMILRPRGNTFLPGGVRIVGPNPRAPIPWVSRRSENSLTWLDPIRDKTNGNFLAASPVNGRVKDQVAEFWRLFYVACTRAKDHLVFSVSNHNYWNRTQWVSWMGFIRTSLQLQNIPAGVVNHVHTVQKQSGTIVVGINDLPQAPLPQPAPFATVPKPMAAPMAYSGGGGSFIPATLDPSTFQILVECPRRYQYQVLWGMSGLREVLIPAGFRGSKPPGQMSPREWGTLVHETLMTRDFAKVQTLDTEYNKLLNENLPRKTELVAAVSNFEHLVVGKSYVTAVKFGRQSKKELSFQSVVRVGSGNLSIPVDGKVDLLFQEVNSKWILVDYKAEEKPPAGSYRERLYAGQIQAYVWLIKKALGYDVQQAYLAYVHPYPDEVAITPDPNLFETQVNAVIPKLRIDPDRGLEAKPSYGPTGPCSSCPFNHQDAKGPCEN